MVSHGYICLGICRNELHVLARANLIIFIIELNQFCSPEAETTIRIGMRKT